MSGPAHAGHWVTTWAASAQGAYPVGSAVAQPDLGAALPEPVEGMRNQSLRMLLRPALWSRRFRVRLSNVFGDRSLRLRGLSVGLHWGGGALVPDTVVALPDQEIVAGNRAGHRPSNCRGWTPGRPIVCAADAWP